MSFFKKKSGGKSKNETFDTFILKNIDIPELDRQYVIEEDFNSPVEPKKKETIVSSITSLEKLGIQSFKREPLVTVISKDKFKLFTYVSMMDCVSQKKLPLKTKMPCFGCRRKYNSLPLGIPIRFVPSQYISNTGGKKTLTIKEKKDLEKKPINGEIVEADYFETDSVVCSFNCMIFVIEENPSAIYSKSLVLINKLYFLITGKYPDQKILKSPSWKMREEYGGPLTDEEYENNLQTVKITDTDQVIKLSKIMQPVGRVFEVREVESESLRLS